MAVAVLILVGISSHLWAAVSPVLPRYVDEFHLSAAAAGVLTASAAVAVLLAAVPAGLLADRRSPRYLCLLAGLLMGVGSLGQALSFTFVELVASRILIGIGYVLIWTAGVVWLASLGRPSLMGATVVWSGVGGVVGPVFVGGLSQAVGLGAPFYASAVVLAIATGFSALLRTQDADIVIARSTRSDVRAALTTGNTALPLLGMVAAGLCANAAGVVVPLELHRSGYSSGEIGVAFSVAGGLLVVACAMYGRTKLPAHGAIYTGLVALVISVLPATLSASSVWVVIALTASSVCRGIVWSAALPQLVNAARQAGIGVGLLNGLLYTLWAVAAVGAPIIAGLLDDWLGPRATFLAIQISIALLAASCWWLGRYRREHAIPGGAFQ